MKSIKRILHQNRKKS